MEVPVEEKEEGKTGSEEDDDEEAETVKKEVERLSPSARWTKALLERSSSL